MAEDAKFCVECGSPKSAFIFEDFIYLLSEDKVRSSETADFQPPYGCLGITFVDGVVQKIQRPQAYSGNNKNTFKEFLRQTWDFTLGLVGQQKQSVKSYIMLDLSHLPVVTYSHPIPSPGFTDATLKFKFWVDADDWNSDALGLFFQRVLAGKVSFTINDLRQVAIESISNVLKSYDSADIASGIVDPLSVSESLKKICGISSECEFVRGSIREKKQFELSKVQKPVSCNKCNASYTRFTKFCIHCGNNLAAADWAAASDYLQSSDGQQITLKVSLYVDVTTPGSYEFEDESRLALGLFDKLASVIRKLDVESLMTSSVLTQLSNYLNKSLHSDWQGYVSEISVNDIRTAKEDWFFRTDSLIEEERRRVEANKRFLAVDEAELDLDEAAFSLAIRRVRQADSQELILRRQALEAKRQTSALEVDEYALDTGTTLTKEGIEDRAEQERLAREKARRERERDFTRGEIVEDRKDEVDSIQHQAEIETLSQSHDHSLLRNEEKLKLDLAEAARQSEFSGKKDEIQLQYDAERKQLELQSIRQELEEAVKDKDSAREKEKIKALAEIEAAMAAQEHALEINLANIHKTMTEGQILANTGARLVGKEGGAEVAAAIASAISSSKSVEAAEKQKEELVNAAKDKADAIERVLTHALDAVANATKAATAQSVEGYKEAAKISQSVNEKSMESMAKVATAAAGKKVVEEKLPSEKAKKRTACINPECDWVFDGKVERFCPNCGDEQPI